MAASASAVYAIRYLELAQEVALRKERVFRDKENAFELHDREFRLLFRMPKAIVLCLIDELRPALTKPTRSSSLTVELKVLAALRFYATGSYQRAVGQDVTLAVSQVSISRCVDEVSKALCQHLQHRWIKFPNLQELQTVKNGFKQKYNFSGVIGAIDCTHVAIIAPSPSASVDPQSFVNRKGFHSLNVQVVCDSQLSILSINARYPGCSHDSYIWGASRLKSVLVEAHRAQILGHSWLLGDEGYPLEPWLLTPIAGAADDSNKSIFNATHAKARTAVECCFGMLKQVWRCLLKHRVLHYAPQKAAEIVVACAVLHNIYIRNNLPLPQQEENCTESGLELHVEIPVEQRQRKQKATASETALGEPVTRLQTPRQMNPLATEGKAIREALINQYFNVPRDQ